MAGKSMTTGLSEKIRDLARTRYVAPALFAGKQQFSIRVRDLLNDLEREGLHGAGRTPQVCSALQTAKFLRTNGLEIDSVEGPPKMQSPTVVVHYRVAGHGAGSTAAQGQEMRQEQPRQEQSEETPEEWAHRMTGKLYGLLREEITAMGGAEAFIRWVRSDDEENAGEDAA
jgi:hypothetical protein